MNTAVLEPLKAPTGKETPQAVPVTLTLGPTRTVAKADADGLVLTDVDSLVASSLPGCGDDNPYN
ncbi:hypothetical protein ACFYNL_38345 [Streptomyces sp. NPDC007808]|uniref:hypothetical protein n=1 Tax=Streptomyces sp. NPDC007808 TaxID=3364779 RepID=UPI0036BBFA41